MRVKGRVAYGCRGSREERRPHCAKLDSSNTTILPYFTFTQILTYTRAHSNSIPLFFILIHLILLKHFSWIWESSLPTREAIRRRYHLLPSVMRPLLYLCLFLYHLLLVLFFFLTLLLFKSYIRRRCHALSSSYT